MKIKEDKGSPEPGWFPTHDLWIMARLLYHCAANAAMGYSFDGGAFLFDLKRPNQTPDSLTSSVQQKPLYLKRKAEPLGVL